MDAPPTSIEVGGKSYMINTDFRVWLTVMELYRGVRLKPKTEQQLIDTASTIEEIERIVFGKLIEENVFEILNEIGKFMQGYPTAPMNGSLDNDEQTYSFEFDLNEIIIAIRNQHGIDLSYRNEKGCHWWEFLLYFRTLAGEHYILNLMSMRGYKGNDKDMLKRKARVALPTILSTEEQDEADAFNAMFEGTGE